MFNLEERRSFLKRSILAIGVALVAPTTNVFAADALTGVSATSKTYSGLTIKWNRFYKTYYSVSSYKVYYKFDSGSTYCRTLKSSATSTTLTKSGWKKCQVYVVAYGSRTSGMSTCVAQILAKSSTYTFTYGSSSSGSSTRKLPAPTWKSATSSGSKVTLKWNAVSNAGSYTIQYKAGSGSWQTLESGWKSTTYTCSGQPGTYTFRLYANSNKSGYSKSNASATRTVKIAGKKLGTPTFELCVGKSNQIKVIVAANSSDYKKYVVPRVYAIQYRKSGASSWKTVYIEAAAKNNYPIGVGGWMDLTPNYGSYVLKGLTNNATYQFRVKAFACSDLRNKGYANSNWSSTKSAKVKKGSYWGYGGSYAPTFVDYNISRNSYAINF